MKVEEVKGLLAQASITVEVQPTKQLFPFSSQAEDLTHFSIVCQNHAEQRRVHHWIEFRRPDFEGFDCWAAYVEAITERGPSNGVDTHPPLPKLNLPPGVAC